MGVHWYAKSNELIEIARQFEEVERRIMQPDADERAIDAALDDRELLFTREREARAELERLGFAVTIDSLREWPPHVLRHIHALGPAEPDRRFLDLLGWGTDYYVENLRDAGVRMDAFSHHLDYLCVSPEQACMLGEELLTYASKTQREIAIRRAREAGLWLFFWGYLGCSVQARQ